jgi:hypothetical protein
MMSGVGLERKKAEMYWMYIENFFREGQAARFSGGWISAIS